MDDVQESGRIIVRPLLFARDVLPADLGHRVRDLRRARRWSQDRLATRAGVNRATVQRLEDGRRPPASDTVFRIAAALGTDVSTLAPGWPEWNLYRHAGHGPATRARRRELGISLAALAEIAGVSEAALSRHERGIGVSPRLLARVEGGHVACNEPLARALGFSDAAAFDAYCET